MYTEWDFIEALQKTNFSLDLDFYDENTIDLIDSLRKHLPSGWTFSTGATKCVLIPEKVGLFNLNLLNDFVGD